MATFTGDKKIDRMFSTLATKTRNKILRDEIKRAALPMRDKARQDAPRDEGDLAAAIKIRAMRRRRNHIGRSVVVDPNRLQRARLTDKMRSWVAGLFQEYGTKHHKAQAYMKPTFKQLAERTKTTALNNIKAAIEAAASAFK